MAVSSAGESVAPAEAGERLDAVLGQAVADLRAAGVETARLDARLLLAAALGATPAQVLAYPERRIGPSESARFAALLARRRAREPVSRILGRREFWSLDLAIGPATLDPRPDSETLVEALLARLGDPGAPRALLDLGTGSGCLLLALLSELSGASGLGVDLDPAALAVARENAVSLGLAGRARFLAGDWGAALAGPWDAVVCNPPYVESAALERLTPEVAGFDPRAALDGGADGLDAYRALAPDLVRLLAPGGLAALEVGAGQAEDVEALLARAGLRPLGRVADLSGVVRCLLAGRVT
jgi:release factor glutamine methyltransferase